MTRFALTMALLMFSCIATAQDRVTIAETTPYADGIGSDDIRKECDWNIQLGFYLSAYTKTGVDISAIDVDPTKGKVLSMSIINVHALGGGGLLGPNWATIRGELREAGHVVGSFVVNRTTGKGGPSACESLDLVARAIAKDISIWLRAPSIDARLGNTR